jgi:hypothetical protein
VVAVSLSELQETESNEEVSRYVNFSLSI